MRFSSCLAKKCQIDFLYSIKLVFIHTPEIYMDPTMITQIHVIHFVGPLRVDKHAGWYDWHGNKQYIICKVSISPIEYPTHPQKKKKRITSYY
jgi:hypothetical protein